MGYTTEINWTDCAFNPWIGCNRISEACQNCYAAMQSDKMGRIKIWSKGKHLKVWGADAPRHFQGDDYWRQPVRWNERARAAGMRLKVFSADMSDVFERYEGDPGVAREMDQSRARLWSLIERTPWLDWQLLTKRPENIRSMTPWRAEWPRNVWVGATVENQARANERIPHLIELPAVVRFLSVEPMLGPIDLSQWPGLIDWVIAGCESITKKRPTDLNGLRDLRDQCVRGSIAFWFKQWGVHTPGHPVGGTIRLPVPSPDAKVRTKKFATLDGLTWNQYPAYRWRREGRPNTIWERLTAYDDDLDAARSEGAS